MKIKNKFIILGIFILSFFLSNQAFASTTDGIIDPTYRYGWGENVGWVDFGSTAGAVHITDDALSGYAYGENIGWINLGTVTNDKEGHLSGYAWGENVGFIDFSQVTVDSHGYFLGQAYGENIGFISFNKDNTNNVMTDWRPKSSRSSGSSSSSGSTPMPIIINNIPTSPTTPVVSCPQGDLFNTNTGAPCLTTPTTFRALKFTTPRMTGVDVKDLQAYLNTHSYNCGIADGIFGNLTKQAVIKFQLANQLKGDGIVGPLTRALLK